MKITVRLKFWFAGFIRETLQLLREVFWESGSTLVLPGEASGAVAPGGAGVLDVGWKIGHPWRLVPGHPSVDARSAGQSIKMLWHYAASPGGGTGHPWPFGFLVLPGSLEYGSHMVVYLAVSVTRLSRSTDTLIWPV